MKIFLQLFFATLLLTNGCSLETSDRYKDTINETLNPLSGKIKEVQNIDDVSDMKGCQVLIKQSWSFDNKWGWGAWQEWKDNALEIHQGITADSRSLLKSPEITNKYHPIYIGPWQFSKTVNKQIRFYAYTGKNGGYINYQFESQNEENKSIPEKKFSLPTNPKAAPDKFGLCVTKWIANYGYNAVSEVKSRNPFSKNYLMPTGKIIQTEN